MLCIIGSAIWVLDGVRRAILGGAEPDWIGSLVSVLWAVGGLCGMLGLIALKATGTNTIVKTLSFLPVVGFGLLIVGSVLGLAAVVSSDDNWLIGLGWLLQMVGVLMVGIFTIAAKTWSGWHKVVPLLCILVVPVGLVVWQVTGVPSLVNVVAGIAWMLLGYVVAVRSSTSPAQTSYA